MKEVRTDWLHGTYWPLGRIANEGEGGGVCGWQQAFWTPIGLRKELFQGQFFAAHSAIVRVSFAPQPSLDP
jgi:hypothetical protein